VNKAGKIIGKIISTIALIGVILLALVVAGPRLIGWQPFQVLSGSMEPTYHVGSVIYVKKTPPQEIKVNDPITFYLEDGTTVVTHRAVKIDTQKQLFYTKGDANNVEDGGATPFSRLLGKPMLSIPKLGYATAFINTKQGLIIVATLFICMAILTFLPDMLMKKAKNKSEPELDEQSKGG
jgi:signal peptidase